MMEDISELFDTTIKMMMHRDGVLREDRENELRKYIRELSTQIEGYLKTRRIPNGRLLVNINAVLNDLRSKVNQYNDEQLRGLVDSSISDLGKVKTELNQEKEERNDPHKLRAPFSKMNESTRSRLADSKNPMKNKNRERRNYMDYTQVAIEQMKTQINLHKSISLTPLQIRQLNELSAQIAVKVPRRMREIHDEGVTEETRMINQEVEKLYEGVRNRVMKKEKTSQGRLGPILDLDDEVPKSWDLRNFGTTREEVNNKTVQAIKAMQEREASGVTEKESMPRLSGDCIK